MSKNQLFELEKHGQSVWIDNISRSMLRQGNLKELVVDLGVRGLTSNPTIFDKAIGGSSDYDEQIASLAKSGKPVADVLEELMVADISQAADVLRPIYNQTGGNDGFVSIEVSPLLARDASGTISAARRLFDRLNHPNVMVKIPGTPEGIPAIREALERGININVTLLFSVENYEAVAQTYCEALRSR
ncbi:MAG: hypothetical protein KDD44_14345, partial [Bdellovibrionales bacterium]|nr:hypothetical protein [Bdellovibrionales bacterium]